MSVGFQVRPGQGKAVHGNVELAVAKRDCFIALGSYVNLVSPLMKPMKIGKVKVENMAVHSRDEEDFRAFWHGACLSLSSNFGLQVAKNTKRAPQNLTLREFSQRDL